tara:strand:+ start:29 stop:379 length:351 start_codon:yes stop_codon:yes gene_type:complete
MAHLFCHSCGAKLTYLNAKPNFCEKCGEQLNSLASTTSSNTSAGLPVLEKSVVISQDETDAQCVPTISNLQVEVQASDKSPMTFGSLIGESTESDRPRTKKARSINEFIDEKKKEG